MVSTQGTGYCIFVERDLTGRHPAASASHRFDAQRNAGAKQGHPVRIQFDCYDTSALVWDHHFKCPAGQAERTVYACGIDGCFAREGEGDWVEEYHRRFALRYVHDVYNEVITFSAIGICFSMADIYRSEILAVVMQQIVDEPILPTLFLRTVSDSESPPRRTPLILF
jgi:hypothetical protein